MQDSMAFPASLSEKYRPKTLDAFVGLEKPRKVLSKFAANPFPNAAFLFVGPSGTGKTSAALALCEAIRGELHHIPSQSCNVATVEAVCHQCWYVAHNGGLHVVLVDEADQMTSAAQLAFLSKLDATAWPPQTVFIFTCNATDKLQDRFLSRCMTLEFSSHGMSSGIAALLKQVWDAEVPNAEIAPNFERLTKNAANNVRDAINSLQVEILAA